MPGTSITKHNFTTNNAFLTSLVADLTTAGFTKVFPTETYNPSTAPLIVMQATVTVDTLAGPAAQPWRICLRKRGATLAAAECVDMIVGTPNTIKDDGTLATIFKSISEQSNTQPAGLLGSAFTEDVISATDPEHRELVFWSRADRSSTSGTDTSNPFSYKLTTTDRGIALHVWEPGTVLGYQGRGPISSTVVIQRLVDNSTGVAQTTGKSPLHCVYALDNKFKRFVVRENDIQSPSNSIDAETRANITAATTVSTGVPTVLTGVDYIAHKTSLGATTTGMNIDVSLGGVYPPVIHNRDYIAITEDNNYVTTFPSGFSTSRYAYYGEMDLIAYTSADVVANNAVIQFTAYGEATPRKYQAISATGVQASKLRLLMLVDGGGTTLAS